MSTQLVGSEWIWKDGEFMAWEDCHVHMLSLAVQFGCSVFEGLRCYETLRGPAIFRLDAHVRRLFDSARIYRMQPDPSPNSLKGACLATVKKNGLRECYLRPTILRGYGSASMNPEGSPVETYVPAWAWGEYLGAGALERGVDVCVSSWARALPNTFPVQAKAGGNYVNAQLMKMEALANGYDDAIALAPSGLVSEGSGMNLFLVRDGELLTPNVDGASLMGITRDAVIKIAGQLDIPCREATIPREMLYTSDELFFTGTAVEVTPVCSVDRIEVGEGRAGPISLAIQSRFMQIAHGEVEDEFGWLTLVDP